jgi:hypothetical protein
MLACIIDKILVALEFAFRLPSPRLAKCLQDPPDRSTLTRRNVVVGRREPALNIYDGETPILPIVFGHVRSIISAADSPRGLRRDLNAAPRIPNKSCEDKGHSAAADDC